MAKMMMMQFLLARLAERTTWLGLTAFAVAAGVTVEPEMMNQIATAGVGVAGLIGMITKK